MKKNGFTLIEILGVITLIALIATIVIIVIDKSLKDSKETVYNIQIENIKSAASMWRTDNIERIPDDGYYTIFLSDLQDNGYIEKDIVNPKTNQLFSSSYMIKVGLNDILIDSERSDFVLYDEVKSIARDEASIITTKVNSIYNLADGVYYFDDNGNLEKGGSIIHLDSNSTIKGNILIHNKKFISGCFNYGDMNFDYYKGTLTDLEYKCSTVRGENLVVNGDLSNKSNFNFSGFTYNSDGYLTRTTSSATNVFSDFYIPVDTQGKYEIGQTLRVNNSNSYMYGGFASYDIDKKEISTVAVMYINNTLTTLAKDLNPGDEYVYLTSMTNWNKTATQTYQRGFIFWNYVDSTGYQYPELTYSRNVMNNLYTNDNIDASNNRIKLTSPWNYGTFKAGTKLSQANSGAAYNYTSLPKTYVPSTWTNYHGTVTGINTYYSAVDAKFRAGTTFVKWIVLTNFNSQANTTTDVKDIYFKEVIN